MALRDRISSFLRPAAHDSRIVEQAPAVAAAEIVRRFWPFARPYRRWIALGLLLLLLVPAIDAVEIYLFKLVVDDVLVPQELAALVPIAIAYMASRSRARSRRSATSTSPRGSAERFLLDLRGKVYAHVHPLSAEQLGGARRAVRPLGKGARSRRARPMLEHLHRSNALDVYDAWNEPRGCRVIVKTLRPDRLRVRGAGPGSCARDGC